MIYFFSLQQHLHSWYFITKPLLRSKVPSLSHKFMRAPQYRRLIVLPLSLSLSLLSFLPHFLSLSLTHTSLPPFCLYLTTFFLSLSFNLFLYLKCSMKLVLTLTLTLFLFCLSVSFFQSFFI